MATYDLTSVSLPNSLSVGDIINYRPPGGNKIAITLPAGIYQLECWGAQGGYRSSSANGGKGGYSIGTLNLPTLTQVFLYAGGAGGVSDTSTAAVRAGGFNGGGYRYGYPGGGGGSDIRINEDSLYARVIVAGGGGSDGAYNKPGGYGGGTVGESRSDSYTANGTYCGKGGNTTYSGYSSSYTISTQATSGLNSNSTSYYCGGFGFGGGGVYLSNGYGGAGGGGWYGGAGTVPDGSGDDDRGGGGGSGYVYTTSTVSQYPSGCKLTEAHLLTKAETRAGSVTFADFDGNATVGNYGDGAVRITVMGQNIDITNPNTRIDTTRILQKGNVSLDWNPNFVLLPRELGVETDTGRIKVGNGTTRWADLPYVGEEIIGTVPISQGGTGGINVSQAKQNLQLTPEDIAADFNSYADSNGPLSIDVDAASINGMSFGDFVWANNETGQYYMSMVETDSITGVLDDFLIIGGIGGSILMAISWNTGRVYTSTSLVSTWTCANSIPVRNSDPTSPQNGDMWFRGDL